MFNKLKKEEKWMLLAIPIIFILGSLFHFLYEFSNQNPIVSLIAAVNESVWEHNKMVVLPPILFWITFYFIKGKQFGIDKNKWFTSALIAVLTMIIIIPIFYYFYTGAFGIEALWIDILILLIANILGQLVALHFYKHAKGINWFISLSLLLFIIFIFAIFTYYTPHIPLFIDTITGTYGI